MNIEGLGESIIDIFLNKGFLKNYSDIYALVKKKAELLRLDRFGEKSVDNIIAAIEESRNRPFDKVLFALGIRHVGERTAKILADNFGSIENIVSADEERILQVNEIGPKIAESISLFMKDKKNLELIEKLKKAGLKFESGENTIKENINITNKTFVLTGTLEKYKREEAQKIIEDFGGKVGATEARKPDIELPGEEAGSKQQKAVDLGVKIISESDFEKMIKG